MVLAILRWMRENKLAVFFMLTTTCLLISTVALAHKNSLPSHKIKSNEHAEKQNSNYRLPPYVIPKNYKLLLDPNITSNSYNGLVIIKIQVLQPTKQINLHSKNLEIMYAGLNNGSKGNQYTTNVIKNEDLELLYIISEEEIIQGNYWIEIKFKGKLNSKAIGFYASTMKNGEIMVASKFQPTYARQAFPCFDEPEYKATYDITLVKPTNSTALSNMNQVSITSNESSKTEAVTFATSVPMSTYLACFVICDFGYKQTEIDSKGIGKNFTLRCYGQKDKLYKIDFAMDIAKKATEYYIQYYSVPYPLPKLDMIAIPDYTSGATEHWGLVTYRETSFLIDKATASVKNQIAVANTIAHELAHMWFGNLVTVKWWNDLWLNEGFATYMQTKALNAIEPSWTALDQFLVKTMHPILASDAKLSSRPIVHDVTTPDEITAIFDLVSYNKGSSILRMLEGFIGEENFRNGISDYLMKYEFGSTVTRDLLTSLLPYFSKKNPDLDLMYIMDTWTNQMGYPLVTVTPTKENNTFILTQKRFLMDPKAKSNNDSPFNYRWFIPITYKTDKGLGQEIVWFPDDAEEVKLTIPDGAQWLKVNNNQVGYYRTNYSIEMWNALTQQLLNKSKYLTISDRAHLINEIFALAHAQIVPYSMALNVCRYLKVEEDFVPWEAVGSAFGFLNIKLRNTPAVDDFLKFVQGLIEPMYKKHSWENTPSDIMSRLVRAKIFTLAVKYELPDAKEKVRNLFVKWITNYGTSGHVTIEPDLRDLVYYHGMKSSSQEEWDKFWKIYTEEDDPVELNRMRSGLAAPHNSDILKKYLSFAWDERNVRSQDYLSVLQHIADNPWGTELVWVDLRNRWPELVDRFTINSRYLGNAVYGITSTFNSVAKLKEMESFFKQYPEAGAGENARRQALENVRNNIEWVTANQPVVVEWLKAHV